MKHRTILTHQSHWKTIQRHFALAGVAVLPLLAYGADTNWVAFNDHVSGALTKPNVTTYTVQNTDGNTVGGTLTDFGTGLVLPAGVQIRVVGGSLNGYNGGCTGPSAGTPAGDLFNDKVGWENSAFYFCASPWTASHTITFTNLDSAKKYIFKGAAVRGRTDYTTRWGSYMLVGAASATPAHEQGPGSRGVVTNGWSPYGDLLAPNTQVAINCGDNTFGDLIVWTDIVPDATSGSFSVVSSNWLAATPAGAGNTTYGYAINAFMLVEVEAVTQPVAIVQEPVGTNVLEFRPFSLRVVTTGSRPQFQWYKDSLQINGATSATYAVAQAQVDQTGDYYCVVSNSSNSVQSATVRVTVQDDTDAPAVVQAVGSATFNQITIQFTEILNTNVFPEWIDFLVDGGMLSTFTGYLTNNNTVIVLITDNQVQNQVYTVDIPATVTDLAGNPVAVNQTTFTSWVTSPFGGVVFQVYTNLSTTDNAIGQLTNNAKFPEYPDATYVLTNLNTRDAYPDDTHEGYGGRLRSLFIPSVSGKFRFFLYSDDSSLLYFNPNGPDPAGRVLVAYEAGCCNVFREPPATQTSEPFDLVAGKGYYIEANYKEGGGGDYCQVAARLEGDPIPAASLTPLGANYVGFQAVPPGVVGTVSIAQQPVDLTVEEPAPATFTVAGGSTLGSPFVYQWQRAEAATPEVFADIPQATGARHTLASAHVVADNGARFRAIAKSPGGELTSDAATLTVDPDVTNPRLVSAVGSTNLNEIIVTFSEAVDPGTATDTANYFVTGSDGSDLQPVGTGTMLSPMTVVIQTLNPRVWGINYTLRVENVKDVSVQENTVLPPYDTAIVSVTGVILPFVSPWSYNALGAPGQGTAWKEPGYNDSTWPISNALFCAKNGTPDPSPFPLVNALIPMNGTNGVQITTYYFRTHFELSAYPSNVAALLLRIDADDGAVVYLNGKELYSIGMAVPPPPITYDTFANRTVNSQVDGPFSVPTTNLVYGDNVVAVEVHQVNATSSDIYFALELSAQIAKVEPPRPPVITTQPVGGTVNEGQSFTFSVLANGAPPLSYQWYLNNILIGGATNSTYFIASAVAANQGEYYVVVDNPAASPATSSPKVQLTVNSDSINPTVVSAKGGPAASTTVVVTFSEAMAVAPAQTVSNYELTGPGGITVVGAVASGSTVTLTLSGPRQAGVIYNLTVKDLTDTAFVPNVIVPNPTTLPVATVVELVSINGQSWKFLQQTVDGQPAPCLDGTPWTEPGYNDSAWQSGFGVFYGLRAPIQPVNAPATLDNSAVNTFLNLFTNGVPANGIQQTNYYFRTTFNLPSGTTNGATLLVHSMVDDGAVFYLNGNRVGDVRYLANPAYCTNFSSAGGNQSWEPALASPGRVLGLTGLVPGQNTLAVQVAQNNGTSSDITLGVLLEAEVVSLLPALHYVYDAGAQNLTLSWEGEGFELREAEFVTGPWTTISSTSPKTVSTATGTKFYRLRK
jgi:hypothetical protein